MSPKYKRSPRTDDEKAIERFLRSPEGRKLLDDLSKGFTDMEANVTIELEFKDSVGAGQAGEISPQKPASEASDRTMTYSGKIGRTKNRDIGGAVTYYPDRGDKKFTYTYVEGISEMASTIYHEIQHVYFMNRNDFEASAEGADPNVDNSFSLGGPAGEVSVYDFYGHALDDAARDSGNYDPAFLDGLKKFAGDLDDIEKCAQGVAPTATPGPTARPGPTASPGPTAAPGTTAGPDSSRRGSGTPR